MAKQGPINSNIDIYLRVKPVSKPSPCLALDTPENRVEFNVPRDQSSGYVNNQREHYDFRFTGILGPEAKQDEVFERVARVVVTGALEGMNGTVFAYGQTGSGKTFTVTGGPERYVDRGIIPRSISTVFSEISKRSDYQHSVHISYLEIYNEAGYDLLDPAREVRQLEDLPRVHILEDEEQRVHMRNLSVHRANTEEEALNLLFLGDTNRTISETPMNMASSRSHCVFTIHIEARKAGEEVVRRSKLNLVDLAGSERVAKTALDGSVLREAKFINLSLHYLEQVIIALQERALGYERPHVPYRNSIMTMVLRDSLGGNCKTVMVANITGAGDQLDESISTCRFAQRVAMVSNEVVVNEEVDPALVIKRLKAEIRELREEIRLLRGGEERGPLTPDELARLRDACATWLADDSPSAELPLPGSMMFVRAALEALKSLAREAGSRGASTSAPSKAAASASTSASGAAAPEEQMRKLKLQVQQRDNEINILVSMLKKREAAITTGLAVTTDAGKLVTQPPAVSLVADSTAASTRSGDVPQTSGATQARAPAPPPAHELPASSSAAAAEHGQPDLLDANVLADRSKAFEVFRRSYRKNEVIEENKALLKTKYKAAKDLGAQVNACKQRITELKALIEQRRIQRSVASIAAGLNTDAASPAVDADEERAKAAIEMEKAKYKDAFNGLRELKQEIENLQALLEKSKTQLARDFEHWLELMARQQQPAGTFSSSGHGRSDSLQTHTAPLQAGTSTASSIAGARLPSSLSTPRSAVQQVPGHPVTSPSMAAPRQDAPPLGPVQAALQRYNSRQALSPRRENVQQLPANTHAQALTQPYSADMEVMKAVAPLLTGNPAADRDIIKFYEARAALLRGQQR